jgi:Uncharacterized conserved protein
MRGWKRWALFGGIAIAVFVVGGPFVYFRFIQGDAPAPLSINDTSPTVASGAPASALASFDGTWKVASGSRAGYRVKETVFGQSGTAVGRTSAVTGQFTLAGTKVGAASFSVDMSQVASNKSLRDNQFQGRIMDTAQFPTATFELTSPIELGTLPASDAEITPKATGKLTLHGSTRTVTIALVAVRSGNIIKVSASVPITFADYNIDNPSGGPASVGDNGTLEFLLVLAKAS